MDAYTLKPNDRIIFGTSTAFLYRCQSRDGEAEIKDDGSINFEMAIKEKADLENAEEADKKAKEKELLEAETAAKLKEITDAAEAEKQKADAEREAMKVEMEK